MNPKLLLENFDLIAQSIGGVQRLRVLILNLAVRGKLVSQDPKDEPASELLKRIRSKKAKLVKEGKIRVPKELTPITNQEKSLELPKGWEWVRLGDVVLSALGGGTPSKIRADYWNGDIPWASVKDLGNNKYISETQDKISIEGLNNSSSNLIPKGRVIVCTRMGLGKAVINLVELAINQDLRALEIHPEIDIDYFYNFYKTLEIKGKGVTVDGIRQEQLMGYLLPLPPLQEQKKIFAATEIMLKICDSVEARQQEQQQNRRTFHNSAVSALGQAQSAADFDKAWKRLSDNFYWLYQDEENVKALRQLILQLAVRGKLVPQDPGDEPASELLKSIRAERAKLVKEGKAKQLKELSPIDDKEKPFELPKGWVWARLSECTYNFGQKVPKSRFTYIDVTGIDKEQGRISENLNKIESGDAPSRARKIVGMETVIYSTVRPNLLNIAIVDQQYQPEPIASTAFAILHPMIGLKSKFLFYWLRSQIFNEFVNSKMKGMAYPAISDGELMKGLVPLPPTDEQDRILEYLTKLFGQCEEAEVYQNDQDKSAVSLASALINSF